MGNSHKKNLPKSSDYHIKNALVNNKLININISHVGAYIFCGMKRKKINPN